MSIRVNVTFSPHIVGGRPRGYYMVASRLFPKGTPILRKDQFVGVADGGLVVTLSRHRAWNTLMHMAVYAGHVASWLGSAKVYATSTGVRVYLPGKVLRPDSPAEGKTETVGTLTKKSFGRGTGDMWYIRVPAVDADILLGRNRLCEIRPSIR